MSSLVAMTAVALAVWSAFGRKRSFAQRAGLRPPAGSAAVIATGSAVLLCLTWRLLRLPYAVLCALMLTGGVAALVARRRSRHRRRAALDSDVVAFCFALAAEVRTGRMPDEALAATLVGLGPLATGVAAAARAVAHGSPVDSELRALAEHLSSQRLLAVAGVWAAAATTGARVADVLERVAVAFTAEDEAAADLEAVAAGPRATATVLTLLPAVGIALAASMGAHPVRLLLHSAVGGGLLAAAALLDAAGLMWVRAVTRRALRG